MIGKLKGKEQEAIWLLASKILKTERKEKSERVALAMRNEHNLRPGK